MSRARLNKKSMGIEEGLPLEASEGGVEALRKDIQRLMDMEAIKQLKHAYFRCNDTANVEELATLLHEDVIIDFRGGDYHWKMNGRGEYLAGIDAAFTKRSVAQHHGLQPEIQILSDREATGIWMLEDHFWALDQKLHTTGSILYWDRYVKEDGRWLIKESRYERLYEVSEVLDELPEFECHYLGEHGTPPQE